MKISFVGLLSENCPFLFFGSVVLDLAMNLDFFGKNPQGQKSRRFEKKVTENALLYALIVTIISNIN